MATIRHLAHAPIVEAIVDFRATLRAGFEAETLQSVKDRLKDAYPIVEDRRLFETTLEFRGGNPLPPDTKQSGLQGYFFKSQDGKNIAQFRVDGFTYNRLAPYTSWEEIRPEALRLWGLYLAIAAPEKIERLALRYINRIAIPPKGELSKYLQILPPYFPGAPKYLANFLMRLSSHDPETGYLCNVTEALERGLDSSGAVTTLDIDAYTVADLGLRGEQLLPILDKLHTIKNEVFFGAITESTAELYQ